MAHRPIESFVRRIPLGRRILLAVILYALSIGALGYAGWSMVERVINYREASEQLQNQAEEISDLAKMTARYQALVHSQLEQANKANSGEVEDLSTLLLYTISALTPPDTKTAQERDILLAATKQFNNNYGSIRKTNNKLRTIYAEISKNSTAVTGLMRIVARPIGDAKSPMFKALTGTVQRANEAFTRALVNINAYYFSADPKIAALAINELNALIKATPVMKSLTKTPILISAIGAIERKIRPLIVQVTSLDSYFVSREQQRHVELAQSQLNMSNAIDALILLTRETQKQSAALLEEEMRSTLFVIVLMTGVLLILSFSANSIIIASIRRPILELQEVMQDLSGGNWDREVLGAGAQDEVGAMARTLSVFKHNTMRRHTLETEKREELAKEKAETDHALLQLDAAHQEIQGLAAKLSNENTRLGAELDVSRKLQEMLLPKADDLAAVVGLDIATYMEPASEVGGDYFDVLPQGDNAHISIGDVTGHGLESGVVMLMTQSIMRTLTRSHQENLPELMQVLNKTLFDNLQRLGGDKNLTLAVTEYKPTRQDGQPGGTLQIVGQHESVLVMRNNGKFEEIDTLYLGMTVGLVDDVREFTSEATLLLNPGDTVIMYTDGITEAANASGDLYGLDRLISTFREHHSQPVTQIKDAIIQNVMSYTNGQELLDDISLVVLKQQSAA